MDHLTNNSLKDLREKYIPPGHGSLTSSYVVSAQGAMIRDVEGLEFIDFASGIGVMNVGHSHPKVVAATSSGWQVPISPLDVARRSVPRMRFTLPA